MDWHPVQEGLEILQPLHATETETGISSGSYEPVGSEASLFTFFIHDGYFIFIKKDTLDIYEFLTAHTQKETNNTNYMYYVILITAGATV